MHDRQWSLTVNLDRGTRKSSCSRTMVQRPLTSYVVWEETATLALGRFAEQMCKTRSVGLENRLARIVEVEEAEEAEEEDEEEESATGEKGTSKWKSSSPNASSSSASSKISM